MQKIDKVIFRETAYIAVWVLIFSAITQSVFLLIGQWDYTVLCGNLLSAAAAVLNFFVMGCVVQRAVSKDPKDAGQVVKLSMMLRLFVTAGIIILGILVPVFNNWTVIIPLFFPQIAVLMRPLWDKSLRTQKASVPVEAEAAENEGREDTDEG